MMMEYPMYSVSSSQCLSFTRFVVDPKSFFVLSTKKLVIALVSGYVPAGYSHPSSSHVAMTDGCVPMRSLQHKRSAAGLALDSSRTYVQTLRSAPKTREPHIRSGGPLIRSGGGPLIRSGGPLIQSPWPFIRI